MITLEMELIQQFPMLCTFLYGPLEVSYCESDPTAAPKVGSFI